MEPSILFESKLVLYHYLNTGPLRVYMSCSGYKHLHVAITKDGLKLFLEELHKKYDITNIENNELIVCSHCLENFLKDGKICQCYNKLPEFENYILCVNKEALQDAEEILRKVKNRIKSAPRNERRRQRERDAEGEYGPDDLEKLFDIQNGKCFYCMCELHNNSQKNFTVDHLIPLSEEGTHWPSNLVLACRSCNSRKGLYDERYFIRKTRNDKPIEWKKEHQKFARRVRKQKKEYFKI